MNLSENSLVMYERWKEKAQSLEKELVDIEEEIENLLLLSQDTEGYHSILVDNFTDLFSVELANGATTAKVNTAIGEVVLSSGTTVSQVFLDDLDLHNIKFKIRSSISARTDMSGTDLRNIFKNTSMVWHTILDTEQVKPVICELIVEFKDTLELNKIEMLLHDAGQSGTMSITPLYSTDDVTYNLLEINDFSKNAVKSASFHFPTINAKYLKFILTKSSPDPSSSEIFRYQFGFKEIRIFKESYVSSTKQTLESTWLSVVKDDGNIKEFEKLTLETCEILPEKTSLDYYIATTSTLPDPTPVWYPISPVNRTEHLHSKIFEIGSASSETINGMVYYDTTNAKYKYLTSVDGTMAENPLTGEDELYSYLNPDSDRILNYLLYNETGQSEYPLVINDSSLILYRDVGQWRLDNQHYFSVVEIHNSEGLDIVAGNQTLSIDGEGNKSGNINIPYGIHTLRIHKHSYNALSDSLKTLIEANVDFLAARKMEKVNIFDMLNNVKNSNLDKFAIDLTLPGKNATDKTVKRAFLVKKDPSNLSETFTVRFNLINNLRKHVKVKAELSTTDSSITPSLDGYQIKLA